MQKGTETRERVLEAAQEMVQERGYNAVSFRDLSAAVGMKAASIHYYFPSKEDLAVALVERYGRFSSAAQTSIDQEASSPARRLRQYVDVVRKWFHETGHMCLCGVLAAETLSLPPGVVKAVRSFFSENETWLTGVLADGRRAGELHFQGAPERTAEALFASIEGALMSAWIFKDEGRFTQVAKLIFESLETKV
jgi:TetR/AcrR family transcriptional repressor of nem operon